MVHENTVVQKPWGYEYLAYQNEGVALWILHIKRGQKTSLHCHPAKTTGLVVLKGTVELNFISKSKIITAPGNQMIHRGVFHQIHAVDTDVTLIEIETPVDKGDLVRLDDDYGRKGSGYEKTEKPKDDTCLWINEITQNYTYEGRHLVLEVALPGCLEAKKSTDIIIFLRGGVTKTIDGRCMQVIKAGDILTQDILMKIEKQMDGFSDGTLILTLCS